MRGKKAPLDQMAPVVGLALIKGKVAASAQTGIPESTIRGWIERPEFAKLRATAREDVAEQMWAAAQIGIAEMVEGLRNPRTPLRDKTDAASMLTEKYLLLTGHATHRTETRDITDTLSPDAAAALADDIDEWLKARVPDAQP